MLLAGDLNGNHVIQRCLTTLKYPYNDFIYKTVTKDPCSIATHRHGCCVIQRCLDQATKQQKRELVNSVINNAIELVKDAYGNYVV